MYDKLTRIGRKIIPRRLFTWGQPVYHYVLALLGAILYRFPSRHIFVVGITGTKGKTTTTELVSAILESAGYTTAIASTLRFKIGTASERNLYKMTMPGRFTVQQFLRRAVKAGCDYAILEMTSEGAKQYRHKFINLDSLILTQIAPEHIESHGSYEAYVRAKLSIAEQLQRSRKRKKSLVINIESPEAERFLTIGGVQKITYSSKDAEPSTLSDTSSNITINGESLAVPLVGDFNVMNILAAVTFAKTENVTTAAIKKALASFKGVPGRMEEVLLHVNDGSSQKTPFRIIVDYAHTAESLEAVYKTFPDKRKICVLGSCGGGRDRWKRPLMGEVADTYCDEIILTNEDPYDEDPRAIVEEVAKGIKNKKPEIIMDRRFAIRRALELAVVKMVPGTFSASEKMYQVPYNTAVLITGKGTDPYIMGPAGTKIVWDDKAVAEEELAKLMASHN
ncbi:MAG: hypothetical protein COV10_04045 [Candidatus Vogelbacteria bacterium CG10_big_fil_rev_8_21_14_0_10_51_16]|uniref:UDP-N-acetylmuramoyl-L-alanyl-D-glutamate--2, 6-diaminopimelate ligase n=1 Tax=Candidatus Vogelbacteria bacterium CG10_big_fil_rev_8_21_14_0_10_51_16 TaxID=1975045 RepID=A0A2H0RFR8_9BACT|nr:MAG: hypothetical protein COV10_04045 [Candidatus Vogelbacteria bacterium CG10_big_fil_rev_8_21_14_0_10_51_16]